MIRIEGEGAVRTVVLDRPERRNALDPAAAADLAAAVRALDADREVRALVLWGAGGCFCAGADLKAVASGDLHRVEPEGDGPLGVTRLVVSKPVIAAVEGYAVAGGLELALWSDLVVAAEDAVFAVACRRFGVPLIDGGTIRLPRRIGMGRALDLILTGREVDSTEALAIGLADRRVATGTARAAAEALGATLAAFPQGALRADLASARRAFEGSLEDALQRELRGGKAVIESGETEAGARRFTAGAGRHGKPIGDR